jgi:quercetin dioxygenase-like cupin family protein
MTTRPSTDDDERVAIFAALAAEIRPVEPGAERSAGIWQRVLAGIAPSPPPAGTATYHAGERDWIKASSHIHTKLLRVDAASGTQELLIRFLPGAEVPAHSHRKEEQMVIIEGECFVGDHRLVAGDVHVAPAGSWHPLITTQTGTLIHLRCEYPFPAPDHATAQSPG